MTDDQVIVEQDTDIAVVTLNRPDALNAITKDMLVELQTAVNDLEEREDLRAVVLTGAGRGFCAGADLHEMRDIDADEAEYRSDMAEEITAFLEKTGKMTVAAIHGPCIGGGNELALACDFRIATDDAVFGQPEVHVGLIPGFGATARLPRIVGWAQAKRLLLTGEKIDAAEAEDIGLVDHVVPETNDIREEAVTFARKTMDGQSPLAYELTKRLLHGTRDLPLKDALSKERAYFGKIFGSHDQQEGVAAFIEKRDPEFTGNGEDTEE